MKFPLISAASVLAMFAQSAGAGILSAPSSQNNLYDFVRDGETSFDGGDSTVKSLDRVDTAIAALELAAGRRQTGGFVGPIDEAANAGNAFPKIPLGAVNGTDSGQDFASSASAPEQTFVVRKAQAAARERMSSLIGFVGSGSVVNESRGGTVFVALVGTTVISPGGISDNRARASAIASTHGNTSTTTITIAGIGILPRAEGRSGTFIATTNGLQSSTAVIGPSDQFILSSAPQPPILYNYAPPAIPGGKINTTTASFSDTVTASDRMAIVNDPNGLGKARIDSVEVNRVHPSDVIAGQQLTADIAIADAKQTGESRRLQLRESDGRFGRTKAFPSMSGTLDSQAITGGVVAELINSVRNQTAKQLAEAFQVGSPSSSKIRDAATVVVSEPLRGKIMASSGALNNSLVLP